MGIRRIRDVNNTGKLLRIIGQLKRNTIEIGIFGEDDSEMIKIAASNEFGANIKAKRTKYLTIPLNKRARERGPRGFDNLFFLQTDDGSKYLVEERGQKLNFMFWLTEQVTIPERSFVRGGFDHGRNKIEKIIEKDLDRLLHLEITIDQFYNKVGQLLAQEMQLYMTRLKSPANSNITLSGKKPKTNPLINSGRMRESVTFKIRRG